MQVRKILSRMAMTAVALLWLARPADASSIVISQIYGGGGNIGATYTNDFIELFNPTSVAINLAGWSLQYGSATGSGLIGGSGQITLLSGTINPGYYYLVSEDQGTGGTMSLPTPDLIGMIAMSATAGKVALVQGTTSLGCNGSSTPCTTAELARIIDLVGYGATTFSEGSAAPGLSNTTADFRLSGGCGDTNNNAADFSAGMANARNSSSSASCVGGAGGSAVLPVPEAETVTLVSFGVLALAIAKASRRV